MSVVSLDHHLLERNVAKLNKQSCTNKKVPFLSKERLLLDLQIRARIFSQQTDPRVVFCKKLD